MVTKAVVNDMHVIAGKDGVRLCRSVRRTTCEVQLYRELTGFPWKHGSGVIGTCCRF